MRLRPYKSNDAEKVVSWIKNEDVFHKWGGFLFGRFPISAEDINRKYLNENGGCSEEDNFYPWFVYTIGKRFETYRERLV